MTKPWEDYKSSGEDSGPWNDYSQQRLSPMEMVAQSSEMAAPQAGSAEALMGLATAPVGAAVAGTRGLMGMIGREDPQATVAAQERYQDALTYQPRTPAGQQALSAISGGLGIPARLAGEAGQSVMEMTGSPLAGAATDVTLQGLPALIARGFRERAQQSKSMAESDLAGKISRNAFRDETLQRATAAGIKVPPRGTIGAWLTRAIAGGPELLNKFRKHNDEVVDSIARHESGLGPNEPITVTTEGKKGTLELARERLSGPYIEVAALSDVANTALRGWKSANAKANLYRAEASRNKTVESLEKAKRFENDADHYQKLLEEEAKNAGRPDLVTKLKGARVAIAKNYAVERAWEGGRVNAMDLGAEFSDNPRPFSGGLATIARMATDPEYSQFLRPGREQVAPKLHMGVGMGLHGRNIGVGGGEWFGQGIPIARGPAASFALSDVMQRGRGPSYGLPRGVQLSDIATKRPLQFLVPSLYNDERSDR